MEGERAGGALSREITNFQVPTLFPDEEGNITRGVFASFAWTWRGRSTLACTWSSKCGNPGGLMLPLGVAPRA